MIPLLIAKNPAHREAAALAFASFKDSTAAGFLKRSLLTDSEWIVRRAAAYSIGQQYDSANANLLFEALKIEQNPVVIGYIVEALGKSANEKALDYISKIKSDNEQIKLGQAKALCRAIWMGKKPTTFVQIGISFFEKETSNEARLYAATALSRMRKEITPSDSIKIKNILTSAQLEPETERLLKTIVEPKKASEEITWFDFKRQLPELQKNPYKLAKSLNDLVTNLPNLRYKEMAFNPQSAVADTLYNWTFHHRYQIVRTTACEYYINHFLMNGNIPSTQYLTECIASRDMALQSLAVNQIAKDSLAEFAGFLKKYQDSLSMPAQIETFIDFEKAICKLENRKYKAPNPAPTHKIDWNYVKQIPDSQRVEIKTTKGDIELLLFVNDAPGTVYNFLKAAEDGFYNDKFFHRVVPNFVIQAGCQRGDGWGSPDWTQRSEFSNYLHYETGMVGMASAGNDTEGLQFFITHNPTPLLEGRYSIFGKVVNGMNVVNSIEVGDKILSIKKI
ncbi:MAG: peptidylprolyl isomerase [Flavobacteriales bacterium]|nr:peptidylprolyl isomerase [Flavobacteriales bacterium]